MTYMPYYRHILHHTKYIHQEDNQNTKPLYLLYPSTYLDNILDSHGILSRDESISQILLNNSLCKICVKQIQFVSFSIATLKMEKVHKRCYINVYGPSKFSYLNPKEPYDTGSRGRTDTPEEHDFESCASANSAIPA